eukprot:TRINITY_DN4601_c0_g1_i1.p1 TRINITY_DN4601_c0_g1~~TRINITY_DN4601_c0_g1_i1.p1  ORF type:complete len:232 (-),score=31.67 TRINITY_DN4601_c0_g1_i1:1716-2411(-)
MRTLTDASSSFVKDGAGKQGLGVLNSKQGFDDSEAYTHLIDWLADKFNELWDRCYDPYRDELENVRALPEDVVLEPADELVQCELCNKWRALPSHIRACDLPRNWFCNMAPYNGYCRTPQNIPGDVITTNIGRDAGSRQGQAASLPDFKPNAQQVAHLLGRSSSLSSLSRAGPALSRSASGGTGGLQRAATRPAVRDFPPRRPTPDGTRETKQEDNGPLEKRRRLSHGGMQ